MSQYETVVMAGGASATRLRGGRDRGGSDWPRQPASGTEGGFIGLSGHLRYPTTAVR
ncbi:hypothetical protein BJ969_003106 [Saccharopolyspora gloriosae]|uniref:Uncharacterized protein n=1 Tax=Saccharopolyspora gloriosae TaxID=455344 RepID=A0A840NI99_9PSEU|nr:hypothetical protein [Saccharopolyspora gloriosae]